MGLRSSSSVHTGAPAQHPHDAFISYAAEDRRVAKYLQTFLQRFTNADGRRLRVYLDQTHIRGGDLSEELGAALESSAALIVVCSDAGARSTWVGREIDLFSKRDGPRIALVLAAGDPSSAIPTTLRPFEIRFHDVRRGLVFNVWRPAARTELLRLTAWLTGANLSTLINWERRRLLKIGLSAVGSLLVPSALIYRYASRRRPIEPSDITAEIVLSWTDEDSAKAGAAIDEVMLNSPGLNVDILPKSAVPSSSSWKWPTNTQRSTGMQGQAVRLVGRLESHALRSSPSVDGVWYESTRRFEFDVTSLASLSEIDEWDGAQAAGTYTALGLGTKPPVLQGIDKTQQDEELTADAKKFYGIAEADWRDMDYSIHGVPVRGALTLSLRNQPVAHAKAMGLRVWEHDEDARNLHVLVFKLFRLDA